MQDMLVLVRDEMEELDASRDLWEADSISAICCKRMKTKSSVVGVRGTNLCGD
ncbi:hypothetical protein V6Z11_A13G150700 [Gossypium hirsutum]